MSSVKICCTIVKPACNKKYHQLSLYNTLLLAGLLAVNGIQSQSYGLIVCKMYFFTTCTMAKLGNPCTEAFFVYPYSMIFYTKDTKLRNLLKFSLYILTLWYFGQKILLVVFLTLQVLLYHSLSTILLQAMINAYQFSFFGQHSEDLYHSGYCHSPR